jgi:hypothetical protein
LASGEQGIAALGDIGAIQRRGASRGADIVSGGGAQRASVLVGQAPQLAQLSSNAKEASLLGDVGGQRFDAAAVGELSKLAGRLA